MMKVQKRTPFEFRADGPMVFFGPNESIATICHCQSGGGGGYDEETGKWWNHFVSKQEAEANAEFIALAVNAHDDLVAALKYAKERLLLAKDNELVAGLSDEDVLLVIDAALAKAEAKP